MDIQQSWTKDHSITRGCSVRMVWAVVCTAQLPQEVELLMGMKGRDRRSHRDKGLLGWPLLECPLCNKIWKGQEREETILVRNLSPNRKAAMITVQVPRLLYSFKFMNITCKSANASHSLLLHLFISQVCMGNCPQHSLVRVVSPLKALQSQIQWPIAWENLLWLCKGHQDTPWITYRIGHIVPICAD